MLRKTEVISWSIFVRWMLKKVNGPTPTMKAAWRDRGKESSQTHIIQNNLQCLNIK